MLDKKLIYDNIGLSMVFVERREPRVRAQGLPTIGYDRSQLPPSAFNEDGSLKYTDKPTVPTLRGPFPPVERPQEPPTPPRTDRRYDWGYGGND